MNENAATLVKSAKYGDTHAFALLYEQIYKALYRFALCMIKNPSQAEDIVSTSVLIAYENIHKLKKEEAFKSWMFQIVANECKKEFRMRSRMIPCENNTVIQHADMTEHDMTEHDMTDHLLLEQAFSRLDEEERLVVGLSIYGGYSGKELSRLLKKKEGTVRSIKSRALIKMKQFIGMEESR